MDSEVGNLLYCCHHAMNLPEQHRIAPISSFPDLSLAQVTVTQGHHLPQWTANGATYHVALHLADSVPQVQLAAWRAAREQFEARAREAARPPTADEIAELRSLYDEHVERYLTAGHGSCLLRETSVAEAFRDVIGRFDGSRYALHVWCLMPNHVHIIVGGLVPDLSLRGLLSAWKHASAHRINALLSRKGEVWHRDGYTRLIRNAEEYRRQLSYVWCNPEAAGLSSGFMRARAVTW